MKLSRSPTFIGIGLFLLLWAGFAGMPDTVSGAAAEGQEADIGRFSIHQVDVQGNTLIHGAAFHNATKKYLGEEKTLTDLEKIRDAVYGQYRQAGYRLASVAIPSRPDRNGVLTVVVTEDILRNVFITGNKRLASQEVLRLLPALQAGKPLNLAALDAQVITVNENPSRSVSVALQTVDVGIFDAVVKVEEQNIVSHSIWIDNTGNRDQEPLRLNYRFSHYGLGPRRDASGIFIYSRSPDNTVKQYLFYYNQPLGRNGDSMYAFASKSNSEAGITNTGYGIFNVAGSGRIYSLHYVRPLLRTPASKIALDIGLEHRSSVDTTAFGGIDVGPDVNSRPLSIGLQYNLSGRSDSLSMNVTYLRNLPGGYLNDDVTYGRSRINAVSRYQVWRTGLTYLHQFRNKWTFVNRYEGQYTAQPLIPDEEFGAGGARSVRGFEEREALGDKGFSASFELYTPPLRNGMRFVLFYDTAQIWRYEDIYKKLLGPATISSTGVGIRWPVNRNVSFSADYAYVIKGYYTPAHDSRIHFNLSVTF